MLRADIGNVSDYLFCCRLQVSSHDRKPNDAYAQVGIWKLPGNRFTYRTGTFFVSRRSGGRKQSNKACLVLVRIKVVL